MLLADDFLRKDVFNATIKRINQNKFKKIVIVGASHSGFSAAWLLLNGPATFNKNNSINSSKYPFFPKAVLKTI